MSEDFRARARLVPKGNRYEDFEVGRVFNHHWGRTITESESTLFSTLTLHFNPHYFNAAYARVHGHPGIVANPLLVFTTVFGLTVEDLSEGGGPFLGVNELTYQAYQVNSQLLTKPFEVYSLLAILYFVLCFLLSAAVRLIERRLTASSRHATVTAGASLSAV